MNTALKEWSVVVDALGAGQQLLLLRKGGIVEGKRGFELRHDRFLLFPTYEHQHEQHVRPEYAGKLRPEPQPDRAVLRYVASAVELLPAPAEPGPLVRATDAHIYAPSLVEMRYAYRPDLPLHVALLRVLALPEPAVVPVRPSYAGCKSWLHLTEEIDETGARPVLDDDTFSARRAALHAALGLGML